MRTLLIAVSVALSGGSAFAANPFEPFVGNYRPVKPVKTYVESHSPCILGGIVQITSLEIRKERMDHVFDIASKKNGSVAHEVTATQEFHYFDKNGLNTGTVSGDEDSAVYEIENRDGSSKNRKTWTIYKLWSVYFLEITIRGHDYNSDSICTATVELEKN
jgi:hypothetical protein